MGDMGDDFRAFREYKNQQKMDRSARNRAALFTSGLEYERVDLLETHFHVQMPDGVKVSFWPSTGAWRVHAGNTKTAYGWKGLESFARKHGYKGAA
jgi:hypothetical protein